ncbi:starvation-inducible DNA-binding protein [Arcticibacter pallidicorallinus]|uniref:Starvation-inducible DNA-binding protein n=1 Tax=Arcticibacter pallidicorallinus TaxID=1259464 RepID=A0A2T0U3B7_9SPHI|nr:DNA starvation/stationary phase protection protein [Arcticibacter pallidicorallinus]PRY52406.1 starvation-inducible DNA-binding protein [Arcticibacter pallidicorallinus]
MKAEQIGLKDTDVRPIVDELNDYLANYHIHYQKLRGAHWNVKGKSFFTLHVKFEELYTNAVATIDELAERILTLGKAPLSTYQDYIDIATIKEINTIGMEDLKLVEAILEDFSALIEMERKLMEATAASGDDGTNDMINRFMQFKEKNTWMLRAFCGKS